MRKYSFPKTYRLRHQKEFERVFAEKCRVGNEWMAVYGWANQLGHPRLGICASTAKVGSAVHRNRWKRLIREAFRLSKEELPPGLDLIVIPETRYLPDLETLRKSLWVLARKLKEKVQKQKARTDRENRSASRESQSISPPQGSQTPNKNKK